MRLYLLAAGRGTRAGGPKAWLERDGKSLLERHLDLQPDAVVAIQAEWAERCERRWLKATFVEADPDLPAFASLHALLTRVPPRGPIFVAHVDHPVWDRGLFDALEAAFPPGTDAAVPTYKGRRGHPVLLSRDAVEDLAKLDPKTGRLDQFLRSRQVTEVPLPYASVLEDWNAGAPHAP